MPSDVDVSNLVREYRLLLKTDTQMSPQEIVQELVEHADWTPTAAEHLVKISYQYGSFMLRNALALSIALDIQDGSLGM